MRSLGTVYIVRSDGAFRLPGFVETNFDLQSVRET